MPLDIETLIAKDAIRDTIHRYCRVLDRMDKDGAYALWNKDSEALYHGIYEGTGPGFIDWVWESHAMMERHSHQVTNVMIEVTGDSAISESYVTVTLWMPTGDDDKVLEIISKGRYLDNWSLQPGNDDKLRWGIDRRENVADLQTTTLINRGDLPEGSRRDKDDPLYGLLPG